jgi:hypothetical protein
MDDQNFSLKGVIQKTKEYIRNWKKLSRLVLIERISTILSGFILDVIIVILGLIVLLFLSMSLAFYIADITGSTPLGFLITSGLYLLVIVIIASLKTKIENKIINLSIRKFLKKLNESDEE